VVSQIAKGVRRMVKAGGSALIEGIGIGAPGSVSWDRTSVAHSPNFPGWVHINLTKALQQQLGMDIPVIVENDANVAGLGSAFFGAGQSFDSFIMVTLGTGVGGAIIYNKKLFRGTTGGAGEIGHVSIDYEGHPSRHGVGGAIEGYLGQKFLTHHARFRLLSQSESLVHQMAGDDLLDLTPKMLYEAAVQGDQPAMEVLAWAGHKLGCALGSVVSLLDIRKVVVGGGVSAAGDFILEAARKAMRNGVMLGMRDGMEIVQETLGNQVGMLGAAHLAFAYMDDLGTGADR
jgi:glucokinase